MPGSGGEQQQGQPLALGGGDHVIESLANRFWRFQIMMFIQELVATFQLFWLEQPHLQAHQHRLLVRAGHPKFPAHAPETGKSERPCPAKKLYLFTTTYLAPIRNWRWSSPWSTAHRRNRGT